MWLNQRKVNSLIFVSGFQWAQFWHGCKRLALYSRRNGFHSRNAQNHGRFNDWGFGQAFAWLCRQPTQKPQKHWRSCRQKFANFARLAHCRSQDKVQMSFCVQGKRTSARRRFGLQIGTGSGFVWQRIDQAWFQTEKEWRGCEKMWLGLLFMLRQIRKS